MRHENVCRSSVKTVVTDILETWQGAHLAEKLEEIMKGNSCEMRLPPLLYFARSVVRGVVSSALTGPF